MAGRATLNHVFRSVFNRALGTMVAVSEVSSANGRTRTTAVQTPAAANPPQFLPLKTITALVALAWAAIPLVAHANPTGGVAIVGQAQMASQGNKLTVTTQNGAGLSHSAINWQTFSIPQGSTTYFAQPNAASTVINRVITNTPSQLFGTLGSNGNLVLVNQSGITVGAGAVIDSAGFTASALRMTDADALAGRLHFGDVGALGANVSVQGNILARSGDVVLIGNSVDTGANALIQAPNGATLLAAGQALSISARGLEGIQLEVQAPQHQALNLGTLQGSAVGLFAGTLKHIGVIQATKATLEGGKVLLKASGDTTVQGKILAAGSLGGNIDVLGQRVALTDIADIDASGSQGGGVVRIGGDYQGKNTALPNAQATYLGAQTRIKADAIHNGDGGKIIVWGNDSTQAYGSLSAKGGANGGNGGFVETSAHVLDVSGIKVNTQAPLGKTGTWLLDPTNIEVVAAGTGDAILGDVAAFATVDIASLKTATSSLSVNEINGSGANVMLQATNNIDFKTPVNILVPGVGLTAQAGNDIILTAGITTNGGDINLTANHSGGPASGTGSITGPGALVSGGGAVTLNAVAMTVPAINTAGGLLSIISTGTIDITQTLSTGAAPIHLISSGSISQSGAGLINSTGLLRINSVGGITLNGANVVGDLSAINTGSGDIRLNNTATSLAITGITQSGTGAVGIANTGSITIGGMISSLGGAITLIANSNGLTTTPDVSTIAQCGTGGFCGISGNGFITSTSTSTGASGNAGDVTIKAGGDINLPSLGINATGNASTAGIGGAGGVITVISTQGNLNGGSGWMAMGGSGGGGTAGTSSAVNGGTGGAGGTGGSINLSAAGTITFQGGPKDVSGGGGGAGGDGFSGSGVGGNGGAGGNAGTFSVNGGSFVLSTGSYFRAIAGSGGSGGSGTSVGSTGVNGSASPITLVTIGDITATGTSIFFGAELMLLAGKSIGFGTGGMTLTSSGSPVTLLANWDGLSTTAPTVSATANCGTTLFCGISGTGFIHAEGIAGTNGGNVTVQAAGDVDLSLVNIDTSGGAVTTGAGLAGGSITATSTHGNLTAGLGWITVGGSGGVGTTGSSGAVNGGKGGAGGAGGSITLNAAGTITFQGAKTTSGGSGGAGGAGFWDTSLTIPAYTSAGGAGGIGGHAGAISLNGASLVLPNVGAVAMAGSGGSGGLGTIAGSTGLGGNAGSITLATVGDITSTGGGLISGGQLNLLAGQRIDFGASGRSLHSMGSPVSLVANWDGVSTTAPAVSDLAQCAGIYCGISGSGFITTSGTSGNAGDLTIKAGGDIDMSSVGINAQGSTNAVGAGGTGGAIIVTSTQGNLIAGNGWMSNGGSGDVGSAGSSGAVNGGTGGAGGAGGGINLSAAGIVSLKGPFGVSGGSGGTGGAGFSDIGVGGNGGAGGNAGTITVSGASLVLSGVSSLALSAINGAGGSGGSGTSSGMDGVSGSSGSIRLTTAGDLSWAGGGAINGGQMQLYAGKSINFGTTYAGLDARDSLITVLANWNGSTTAADVSTTPQCSGATVFCGISGFASIVNMASSGLNGNVVTLKAAGDIALSGGGINAYGGAGGTGGVINITSTQGNLTTGGPVVAIGGGGSVGSTGTSSAVNGGIGGAGGTGGSINLSAAGVLILGGPLVVQGGYGGAGGMGYWDTSLATPAHTSAGGVGGAGGSVGTISLNAASLVFSNAGLYTNAGPGGAGGLGTTTGLAGATGTASLMTLGTAGSINLTGSNAIFTTGGVNLTGSSISNTGVLSIQEGNLSVTTPTFTQSGTINVNTGATFSRAAGFTNTGTLAGTGTIAVGTGSAGLINKGNISPGNAETVGTLTISGDLELSSGSNLSFDLGGTGATQFDKLAVSGNITSLLGFDAGSLTATLMAGYTPISADAMPFLTMGGTATGTFTSTSLPTGFSAGYNLAGGEAARLIYGNAPGTVTFTNTIGGMDWSVAGNWSTGVLPGASETALISTGLAVTHATGADSIAGLTINSANSLDVSGGTLAVSGVTTLGGTLTVSGAGVATLNGVLYAGSTGAVAVSGGTLSLNAASTIKTLNMTGGTLAGAGNVSVTNSFSQSAGSINKTGALSINQASGALNLGTITADLIALTSAGDINLADRRITSTGLITLSGANLNLTSVAGSTSITAASVIANMSGNIALTAGSGGTGKTAYINSNAGSQSIIANGITLTGGATGVGNKAQIYSLGSQVITVGAGGLNLFGGSGGVADSQNSAFVFQGNLAVATPGTSQTITVNNGGGVVLKGGSTQASNVGATNGSFAVIQNSGDTQLINFNAGGTLQITGGSLGSGNMAGAFVPFGSQTITGSPTITLVSGASGGVNGETNSAGIQAKTSQTITSSAMTLSEVATSGYSNSASISAPVQNITVNGSLNMTGGGSGTLTDLQSTGGAGITTSNSSTWNLTLNVTGDMNITSGSVGGAGLVGFAGQATNITANVGGNITLDPGVGTGEGSLIGAWSDVSGVSASPGSINISATGDITLKDRSYIGSLGAVTLSGATITQTAGAMILADSLSTQSVIGTALGQGANQVAKFRAVNTGLGGVSFINTGVLDVQGVNVADGIFVLNNTGGVSTSGAVVASKGTVGITANSPLTIGAPGITAQGAINLSATNLTSAGNMTINGPINSTAGAVNMSAASNFTQNSAVSAFAGVSASAGGSMSFGASATTIGSPVSYTAAGIFTQPPPTSINAASAASTAFATATTDVMNFSNTFTDTLASLTFVDTAPALGNASATTTATAADTATASVEAVVVAATAPVEPDPLVAYKKIKEDVVVEGQATCKP